MTYAYAQTALLNGLWRHVLCCAELSPGSSALHMPARKLTMHAFK